MIATILMMLLTIMPAYATPPTPVSGEFRGTAPPIYEIIKTAGANVFLSSAVAATGYYSSGPIVGTYEQNTDVIWHFGDPETVKNLPTDLRQWSSIPSVAIWRIERLFTGTVNGKLGTLTMVLEAKFTYPTINYPSLEGTWLIKSGTGELSNLHGQGTWCNSAGQILVYEGQIHFDP